MSQHSAPPNRQPPSFVPTLTEMIRKTALDDASSQSSPPNPGAGMPAAFAELLKDWPTLGEPFGVEAASKKVDPDQVVEHVAEQMAEQIAEQGQDKASEHVGNQVALRAEALVMQRLPAALTGLVAQAVRDALREHEGAAKRESPKS